MLITRLYLLQNASTCYSLELKSLWIQVSWTKEKPSKTHIQIPRWRSGRQIKTRENIVQTCSLRPSFCLFQIKVTLFMGLPLPPHSLLWIPFVTPPSESRQVTVTPLSIAFYMKRWAVFLDLEDVTGAGFCWFVKLFIWQNASTYYVFFFLNQSGSHHSTRSRNSLVL